jgi:hypothetical protein
MKQEEMSGHTVVQQSTNSPYFVELEGSLLGLH